MFSEHPQLLNGVGRDGPLDDIEEFVCCIYSDVDHNAGVNQARLHMFWKGKKLMENLQPTKDALQLHYTRVNYQAKV